MSEPDYYAKNGLSPLKAFEQGLLSKEEYVGFCKGNVIKYTIRAGEKTDDPLIDIIKAMDYLHYLHKALKTESVNKEDDEGVYTVSDMEDKLTEISEDISNFKKGEGVVSGGTSLRPRPFPRPDNPRSRNMLSRIREKTIGAWY